jgi:hypothetical protein
MDRYRRIRMMRMMPRHLLAAVLAAAVATATTACGTDDEPLDDDFATTPRDTLSAAPGTTDPGDVADTGGVRDGSVVSVEGEITADGVTCLAMRSDDGAVYTLVGHDMLADLQPGTRVYVEGIEPDVSICQQGTTLEVTLIEQR